MKKNLFSISSPKKNVYFNKPLIVFATLDLFFLLASIIFGIFGLQDTPARSLDHTHAWLGIFALIFVVLLVISSVFTFFHWIHYNKNI